MSGFANAWELLGNTKLISWILGTTKMRDTFELFLFQENWLFILGNTALEASCLVWDSCCKDSHFVQVQGFCFHNPYSQKTEFNFKIHRQWTKVASFCLSFCLLLCLQFGVNESLLIRIFCDFKILAYPLILHFQLISHWQSQHAY